jgi:hypothetical protein
LGENKTIILFVISESIILPYRVMESPFDAVQTNTVVMYLEPILNTYYRTYQNVITLSDMPMGPIADMVKPINPPKLSSFQSFSPFSSPIMGRTVGSGCVYALLRYPVDKIAYNAKNANIHMCAEDIPSVFSYLRKHCYIIETDMTNMLLLSDIPVGGVSETRLSGNRKMICAFTYSPNTIVI